MLQVCAHGNVLPGTAGAIAITSGEGLHAEHLCALQKYHHLYKANTATSHYLLSKVYRAKERIDEEFPDEAGQWKSVHGDPTEAAQKAAKEAAEAKAEQARGRRDAAAGAPGSGAESGQSKSGLGS